MVEERVVHPLDPIIDKDCRILILGSLPSVKSREESFYYANKQNRFWKVISALCNEEVLESKEEKKAMLLRNHIALWDTIHSCIITGSSDASIRDVVPNDIQHLVENSSITKIYCNGKASEKYYKKYVEKDVGMKAITLPSTSPANASYSLDRLIEVWNSLMKIEK